MLSDEAIERLTPAQRRELIERLARPTHTVLRRKVDFHRLRRMRIALMLAGVVVLLPWAITLIYRLPRTYTARNWDLTWAGFDIILASLMAATGWFFWKQRRIGILTSFSAGVLLVCDAWFDVMTSNGAELPEAVAAALLLELPIAFVLIAGPLRMLRFSAARLWRAEPHAPLWTIKFR